jgi:hypothetical protein
MSTREVSVPDASEDDSPGSTPPVVADPSAFFAARTAPGPLSPGRAPVATGNGRARGSNRVRRDPAPAAPLRQVRGTLRNVDLWSVCRVSALIYGSLFLVVFVAGVALWVVASVTGARHSVEHFIASALLLKQFRFASLTIFLAATGIGLVMTAAATGATVALAGFYNLVSEVVGGVELTVVQEEAAGPVV